MSSFYLENLYSGDEETLRSFVLRCALSTSAGSRASKGDGELLPIDMPPVVKCGDYNKRKLKEYQGRLGHFKKLKESKTDLLAAYEEYKKKTEEKNKKEMERIEGIRTRYLGMKERIEQLETPSEYSRLKEFMLRQLSDGIEYDCNYHEIKIHPIDIWVDRQIVECEENVKFYVKLIEEEEKRIESGNAFLHNLYAMLDIVDPYKGNKNTK